MSVSGSNYEIGKAIGMAARSLLIRSMDNYRITLAAEGWTGPWELPEGYLSAAREIFPHLVEELQGMADGSGLSFRDLFFLNSLEEALEYRKPLACTAIAVSGQKEVWLGHNEDWYASDRDTVIVICARPKGKPAFISVTAAPFLAAVGMNETGLAQGVNSVEALDSGMGVPRMFAARAVLEAASLEEALTLATPTGRAGGYNHLLASGDGTIGNLETTATAADYLTGAELIFHTNHYTSPALTELAEKPSDHSLVRYERLTEMADNIVDNSSVKEALIDALSDHGNRPRSICRHVEEQSAREATIFSALFDLKKLQAWVAVGNPCSKKFRKILF